MSIRILSSSIYLICLRGEDTFLRADGRRAVMPGLVVVLGLLWFPGKAEPHDGPNGVR